jgi:predicted dehydrogenase
LDYQDQEKFMSKKIRWGILGCGKIANKFAADLALVEDAELVAVASNDVERGNQFAATHKARIVFNDYESLAASADVDVIYVATPHGFHYDNVMLCLGHHKAVLCEKAFALNLWQVNEMIDFARKQNVFLMEAFWTKFLPQYQKVLEIIRSGVIGEIKMIQADFGFKATEPKAQRLYDPELGGGSLLDVGIYPVFLAQSLLGKPTEIQALITPYSTGADEQCAIALRFEGGALASLTSSFAVDTPVEAVIAGTEGRIQLRNRFHNAIGIIELVTGKDQSQIIEVHREGGFGYQFEARHVNECLKNNLTESPVMTLDDSYLQMQTLDRIRKKCDIHYPVD